MRGLRATATPATRSPPARLCLICRPRDDFLDKEKRLLGEPACRSRSAARPRWRPWHGPCSAHDAVWTGGAHPTSSRLCEKRLHLSSQAASALGGPRAAHNRRSKDLQILIRIRPDFRERLALSRHIDLHANQVPQLTFGARLWGISDKFRHLQSSLTRRHSRGARRRRICAARRSNRVVSPQRLHKTAE